MALITYGMAARHVRISPEESSPPTELQLDLLDKMETASALVIAHLKIQDSMWTAETEISDDPEFAVVQAVVLRVLGHLWRFRGDDEKVPDITQIFKEMLTMHRDPSLA